MGWHSLIAVPPYIHPQTGVEHTEQRRFVESKAKRRVIRAGRRGGKTFGIAILALRAFMEGKRVLYTAPTADQVGSFWFVVSAACHEAIAQKYLRKNESEHFIEVPGTKNRIKAKTAWNAATLRGDYGDLLIFDEYQLTNEDAWGIVGAPMLLDNNGDAVFIYTPPSLHNKEISKAKDPRHAPKLYKKAQADTTGRWATFTFSSHNNPFISEEALADITLDMTRLAYEQEILAEDKDEAPGALWTRDLIDKYRKTRVPKDVTLIHVVVGVDPPGGRVECGIVAAGLGDDGHGYVLDDASLEGSPDKWGKAVVTCYHRNQADRVAGERNYGGDMVSHVVLTEDTTVSYKDVIATRGKAVRAEPVAALYERGLVHHVGEFGHMESEMVGWQPYVNMDSPNRMDALVWALTELMLDGPGEAEFAPSPFEDYRGD